MKSICEAFYFGMKIEVLKTMDVKTLKVKERMNEGHLQYNASQILDRMTPRVPSYAYCMICILNEDIYNKESWNYVFGLASTKNRIGVFSFARYMPSFWGEQESDEEEAKTSELMVYRSSKTMCHEIGHMFGILHCTYYNCLMNGSMNSSEGKIKPFYFCVICLKKL